MIYAVLSVLQLSLQQSDPKEAYTFRYRTDHFHFGTKFSQFFDQRYYINDNWFKEGTDTMVLRIGSESELKTAPGGNDSVIDIYGRIAKKHSGLILALEHRFYGKSQPFKFTNETANLSTDNLQYLTAHQAIADLLYFTQKMDEKYCTFKTRIPGRMNCKWIIIGGSYPGALAGWIMYYHANVYTAGIASSGVVKAILSLPEFDQQTLKAAGTPCANAYQISMREIEDAMENGDKWPAKFLNISAYHLDDFYYFLADTSLMIFQYGNWTQMCAEKLNPVYRESGNVTAAFLDYIKANYNYLQYDREDLRTNMDGHFRQWWYQTCTEVAFFQPAPEHNNIRSKLVDLDYHYGVCNYSFGLPSNYEYTRHSVERINNYFGGFDVYGNETLFSNFWQDVWHDCGLTKPTPNAPNVLYAKCKDCGHCIDLHLDDVQDPQIIKDMRQQEFDFVDAKIEDWRT